MRSLASRQDLKVLQILGRVAWIAYFTGHFRISLYANRGVKWNFLPKTTMVDLGSSLADFFPRHIDLVGSKNHHRHIAVLPPVGLWLNVNILVGAKSVARILFECERLCRPLGAEPDGAVARIRFAGTCLCCALLVAFCKGLFGKSLVAQYQANDLLPARRDIDSFGDIQVHARKHFHVGRRCSG